MMGCCKYWELRMILDKDESKIIASCGWVEKSSLLVIDIQSKTKKRIKISDASYLILKQISDDLFVVKHVFENNEKLLISIHSISHPETKLAEVLVTPNDLDFKGDIALWSFSPKYYTHYLDNQYRLIEIDVKRDKEQFPALEWFDDFYDHGWQSVMDVIELSSNQLLFAIQRDSNPVLYDVVDKKVIKKINLAGRRGNPIFEFNKNKTELWCVDYDTLVKLDVEELIVLKKKKFQKPSIDNYGQFIGGFNIINSEKYCAIARPFSQDVILVDCDTFKIISKSKCKYQPIRVVVLSNYEYVSRDWKTGKIEYGKFKL